MTPRRSRWPPSTWWQVIVNTIAATTTNSGLRVHAVLDTDDYPVGVKITDKQMRQLAAEGRWTRHEWHGEWNYTLHSQPTAVDATGAGRDTKAVTAPGRPA